MRWKAELVRVSGKRGAVNRLFCDQERVPDVAAELGVALDALDVVVGVGIL